MVKKQLTAYIAEAKENNKNGVTLFKEEIEFVLKHNLVEKEELIELDPSLRFQEASIERCNKETEEAISNEPISFLDKPLTYLKEHINEFLFLESGWFNIIGVDAISIEVDDVFGTYDVMLGLKLKKKFQAELTVKMGKMLEGEEKAFDLLFNGEDGLWDVNFSMNNLPQFTEQLTMREAYNLIYNALFQLVVALEENQDQ